MIADLHCHYPMHLVPKDSHPHKVSQSWWQAVKDAAEAEATELAARALNDERWDDGWRVSLDGLVGGGARIVCSVLYWPADEFTFEHTPVPASFADLQQLLSFVEHDLKGRADSQGETPVVVKAATDLDDARRVAFVHCIEGGFHLGPDEEAVEANVAWLAGQGVLYITLAHLFFRGVAANAPAIPVLSDAEYMTVFPEQPGVGLTSLGEAAVRSMYRHKVLVDISHMRQDSIDDTFALIERLDAESGADPHAYPVIATHEGMRDCNPDTQTYNLTAETATRIRGRGGVIGMIMAQHQLGDTTSAEDSQKLLARHIRAVMNVGDGLCAIGTDLDGFIRPTLTGLETASDLPVLEGWLRAEFPAEADAILYGNARALIQRVLAARSST